jgi:D-xylose transport system ATP-binding protein
MPGAVVNELANFRSISKSYGPVRALDDTSLAISAGEVVALVGDNGAGKSTFIKVVAGAVVPDTAEITFEGRRVQIHHPHDAAALGIATIHQDLALCRNLDVVANVFLGQEKSQRGVIDEIDMERVTKELLAELEIHLYSVRIPVGSLSGGQQQCVAVARCLLGTPKLIILDEPTASLGVTQRHQVLDLIKRLKTRGVAVVLISHNIAEVFLVSDRIEVLRLGRNVGSFPGDDKYTDDVLAAMTGSKEFRVGSK